MSQCIRSTLGMAAVFCTALGAQAQSDAFQHDITWPWPQSLGTSGALTSAACADVTGDARPDVFVRQSATGSDIAFFSSPGTSAASQLLGIACNDLCIAPGAGVSGLDALVYVDSGGLRRLDYLMATQEFDLPAASISSTPEWQDARLVRSADVNWSGVADYVGVKWDDVVVYRRDTSPGVFTETTFTATSFVQDIQLVRWLGSGAHLAVAIRLADGLEVRDLANGNSLGLFRDEDVETYAMAVVPSGGTLVDRVAVMLRIDDGATTLRTYKRTSYTYEFSVTITDAPSSSDAASLEAGDMDGDKDYDLVASWSATQDVHVFENPAGQGMAPHFAMEDEEEAPLHAIITWASPSDILSNEADIVFRDVDGDGKADILCPLRREPELVEGELAVLKPVDTAVDDCQFLPDPTASIDMNGDLTINALLGKSLELTGTGFGPEHRYFEVTVWTQLVTDPASLATPTSEYAMSYLLFPITDAITGTIPTNFPVMTFSEIPTDPGECMGDVVRYVEFREVIWEQDRTYLSGPTFTMAVTGSEDMNGLFDDDGCPDELPIASCSLGSGAAVVRHRTRRPAPPPNTQVVLPQVEIRTGILIALPE